MSLRLRQLLIYCKNFSRRLEDPGDRLQFFCDVVQHHKQAGTVCKYILIARMLLYMYVSAH